MTTASIAREKLGPSIQGTHTSHCFEVLVPYDDHEDELRWFDNGSPATLVYRIWAPDRERAVAYARERFRDHVVRHPNATILADPGIVVRREVPS